MKTISTPAIRPKGLRVIFDYLLVAGGGLLQESYGKS